MSKFTTIVCDRCGRKFNKYSPKTNIGITNVVYKEDQIYVRNSDPCKDLCDDCQRDLLRWFYPDKDQTDINPI